MRHLFLTQGKKENEEMRLRMFLSFVVQIPSIIFILDIETLN